jgi:hypothetical protein
MVADTHDWCDFDDYLQCLITAHSSLSLMEDKDRDFFQENFLQGTSQSFCKLRRGGCQPVLLGPTTD